jgi:hypothetical protein
MKVVRQSEYMVDIFRDFVSLGYPEANVWVVLVQLSTQIQVLYTIPK